MCEQHADSEQHADFGKVEHEHELMFCKIDVGVWYIYWLSQNWEETAFYVLKPLYLR